MSQDGHASCTTAWEGIICQAHRYNYMYGIQANVQVPEESTMHARRSCVLGCTEPHLMMLIFSS